MKKLFVAIAAILLVSFTVSGCMAVLPKKDLKPSDYDTGMTMEKALKQDKPIAAVFYADWCTYCQRFMPKMDKVRSQYQKDVNFVLLNVESPENEEYVQEYRIGAFPTVYMIDKKFDNKSHIDSAFLDTTKNFETEVARFNRIHGLLEKASKCEK